jgi:hypothetical protein
MGETLQFNTPSYRGHVPKPVEQTLDRIVQFLGTLAERLEASEGEGRAAAAEFRQQTADLAGLIGARGQTLIGETSADPLLNQIPTGNGSVTSVAVSGGTTGLTTTGGPVTTSGTITMSGTLALANGGTGATTAAGARTALEIDAIATKKSNLSATVAPTVNEDSGDGYAIGSIWVDVTADEVYLATDVSVGAAIWKQLS